MKKLTIEAVGASTEEAVAQALRVLATIVPRNQTTSFSVGGTEGSATAEIITRPGFRPADEGIRKDREEWDKPLTTV